jgi:hypothetical protein
MRVLMSLAFGLALIGCSKSGEDVCKRAGDKIAACFKQKLGDDGMVRAASANATSPASIQACAADERVVAAFEKCMSIDDCDKFMECAEGSAAP